MGGGINVGNIFKVSLKDVDTTKVVGKNLTLVVIERIEPRLGSGPTRYRLAFVKGPLKNTYMRIYVTPIPNGDRKILGLDTIYETWRGKVAITEREAAASMSLVGGQG